MRNGKTKDTALPRGNFEDFQSLEAAHYTWNLNKSGTFIQRTII